MIRFAEVENNIMHPVQQTVFPGGEVNINLNITEDEIATRVRGRSEIVLYAHLQNSDDVMAMILTVDALRRVFFGCKVILYMPYLPYARQDRVCNVGESLSLAVIAQLINSCNFKHVVIADPHSDVAPALINNCLIETQVDIFGKLRNDWSNIHIVAPDAGATKKAEVFAKAVGAASVIQCMKKRDLATGQLSGFVCTEDVTDKHLFILDDICDGGGTFLGLRAILSAAATVELAVTHGIFSKGLDVVANAFDRVYTTNSFTGKTLKGKNVTCINLT